ncbi:MAG: anaerobic ribonucleoside-triphosphate reductase [Promethearchaeota archaeon]
MSSDKNIKDIGNFLKVLQQPIRREILNKLNSCENPMSFSMLQKEVLGKISTSVNFSFYIKPLKSLALISSKEDGYLITNLGKKLLKLILNMEQVLIQNKKPVMIRTSKYSKEKFDINKIEEYLIKEGELNPNLAKGIANQVKKRLKTTKIDYLTAPLMREFINSILIENNLEDVRHKLTRLGTPPYEVSKYFKNYDISPLDFIDILGSDVSEQYLLLNLLPKTFADMYLSGEIILLHLNQWALRPLSIYLPTDNFLEKLYQNNSALPKEFKNINEIIRLILKFIDLLNIFRPYFSEDILLSEFNSKFLTYLYSLKNEHISEISKLLISQLFEYSEYFRDNKPHITLDFNYENNGVASCEISSLFQNDCLFLKTLHQEKFLNRKFKSPLILFDYFNIFNSIYNENIINELFLLTRLKNIIFYNHNASNLLNSAIIRVKNQDCNENNIILDKILINLKLIALKANQNDEMFYSLLQDKLNLVFEFFDYKGTLVAKKLDHMNDWKFIITKVLGKKLGDWVMDSLKSISFIGLNEAIKYHCGIELDRIENSQKFGLNILSFLRDLINEKNETENTNYNLSQPCDIKVLNGVKTFHIPCSFKNHDPLKLIKTNSNLSLDKKILLFKKFEKILDGGTLFNFILDSTQSLNKEDLDFLIESNLQAFTINR